MIFSILILIVQIYGCISLGVLPSLPSPKTSLSNSAKFLKDQLSPVTNTVTSLLNTTSTAQDITDVLNYDATLENLPETALWMTPGGQIITMFLHCNSTCKDEFVPVTDYDKSISFYLYTKDFQQPYKITPGSTDNLDKFIRGGEVKIICHGFWSSYTSGIGPELREAYRAASSNADEGSDINLILVDWSALASTWWYPWAVGYTHNVAEYIARLVAYLELQGLTTPEKVHYIGHSLGAHTGGLFSQYLQLNNYTKPARITGLDPAGPLYSRALENKRLSVDDAEFVDVIHTDGWLGLLGFGWGLIKAIGTWDYFPNGGTGRQPPCPFLSISCSHSISYSYFAESIRNPFAFYGCECDRNKYKSGECGCSQRRRVVMGEAALKDRTEDSSEGKVIHLRTDLQEPFGCGRNLNCDKDCSMSQQCPSSRINFLPFKGLQKSSADNSPMANDAYAHHHSIVYIMTPIEKGLGWNHGCTGVLISPSLVLTTNQCLNPKQLKLSFIVAGTGNKGSATDFVLTGEEQMQLVQEMWVYDGDAKMTPDEPSLLLISTREPFYLDDHTKVATLPTTFDTEVAKDVSPCPEKCNGGLSQSFFCNVNNGSLATSQRTGEPHFDQNGTVIGLALRNNDCGSNIFLNLGHKPYWQWIHSSLNYCKLNKLMKVPDTVDDVQAGLTQIADGSKAVVNGTVEGFRKIEQTVTNGSIGAAANSGLEKINPISIGKGIF